MTNKFFNDSVDVTKRIDVDASPVSTATVRTWKAVNRDVTVVDIAVNAIDTSSGDVSVEFSGVENEMVVYRNFGSNVMTVTTPVGLAFSDGTSSIAVSVDNGTVSFVRKGSVVNIVGMSSPSVLYEAAYIPAGASAYDSVRINAAGDALEIVPRFQTLTDAATIAWDTADGRIAEVTLGGDRTLGYPTNIEEGDQLTLLVFQDGTGNRLLSFHANYIFETDAPVVSVDPNTFSILTFTVRDFGGTLKLVGPSTPGTVVARITAIDTGTSAQSVEYDGEEGEIRTYRNDGTNGLTITAPSGFTFVGGGTDISTTTQNATISLMLNGTIIEVIGQTPIASIVGYTNLSVTVDSSNVYVESSTGNDGTIPKATNVNAGALAAGIIHPNSGDSTLPTSAARIGQIFIRGGATNPGLYAALDTVGNWSGPIT